MNTKETQLAMENSYYTTTTTFGDIKFIYTITK
jgi:hypothetical protein